jgi:hypothetical protein
MEQKGIQFGMPEGKKEPLSMEKDVSLGELLKEEFDRTEKIREKERNNALIFDLERYFWDLSSDGRRRFQSAKVELSAMGDRGVDLIVEAVNEQKMSSYRAVEILRKSSSGKALSGLESLLDSDIVFNDQDRSAVVVLVEDLTVKDRSSSIPVISRFAERRLDRAEKLLKQAKSEKDILYGDDLKYSLFDVYGAVNNLQRVKTRTEGLLW